jgi:hypothetical protein
MAAMMPSASTSNAVYDNDAVERDLIDPDDGASQLPMGHAPCAATPG